MSSSEFEVNLPVDPCCRYLVLASGSVIAAVGTVIILSINLPIGVQALLFPVWVVESIREIRNYLAGLRGIRGLRLNSSGCILVVSDTGTTEAAELETGTMVQRPFAWIRVRFADGRRHGELFLAYRAEAASWHRLQLVWRLCREAFGQPGGA